MPLPAQKVDRGRANYTPRRMSRTCAHTYCFLGLGPSHSECVVEVGLQSKAQALQKQNAKELESVGAHLETSWVLKKIVSFTRSGHLCSICRKCKHWPEGKG